MDPKRLKPMTTNWPLLSPRRPRCPSSICTSSDFSSRRLSFSSDITAEDSSENMEQATYYRQEIYYHHHPTMFTFKQLKQVTQNFHYEVGEGGSSYVYKGWIDAHTSTPSRPGSGMAVAVKIRKPKSHHDQAQWKTEVLYLSRFGHPKIVKLIGFCSEGNHLALVYEYVERGSLDNYLLGGKRDRHPLSWALRIKVAIGIAEGLSFLHDAEIPTIFRDVKSSNVLLDAEFNVKLTDFALAMAGHAKDEHHISTDISGTYGYAAPEYIATGNLSVKSDVYSFGVVLLELLSGLIVFDKTRYNAKGSSLVEWTKPYLG